MLRNDRIRLCYMLDAAQEAIGFAQGRERKDLDTNNMLAFALVRAIEIIGEAASKMSAETRQLVWNCRGRISWECEIG